MDLEAQKRYEAAYQLAVQINKQSWLDEGVTEEKWDEGKRIADAIDTLAGAGYEVIFVEAEGEIPAKNETHSKVYLKGQKELAQT